MKPLFISWHKWRRKLAAQRLEIQNRKCHMLNQLMQASQSSYYADRLIVAECLRVKLEQEIKHHDAKLTKT